MKTKTLTFILCCIAYINSFSQDVIIKNDGKKLEVIIKKVNKNNIKYILFNDPNKVTYTIDKVLITNVEFAFGKKDLDVNDPEKNPYYFAEDKIQNIMLNFSAFRGNTLAFAYERVIKPGQSYMAELKIYGLGIKSDSEIKRSGLGFDFHYRIKTKSFFNKKTYRPNHILDGSYFAPIVGFSFGNKTIESYNYTYYDDYNSSKTKKDSKHAVFHFGIQYGRQWILQRAISVDTSIGFHYYIGSTSKLNVFETIGLGNMAGGGNTLGSLNLRIGFLTGKKRYINRKKD
jgi:hypothetical protein